MDASASTPGTVPIFAERKWDCPLRRRTVWGLSRFSRSENGTVPLGRRYAPQRVLGHGFTLVEMMVVIVIIGILAGLITGAVVAARTAARRAAIKMEIEQLQMAVQEYKNKYGEYPPDFTGIDSTDVAVVTVAKAAVNRHLRKRFPRYDYSAFADPFMQMTRHLRDNYDLNVMEFDAATALAFWLGGLPENKPASGEKWILAGFHSNPENPFQTGLPRDPESRLFEFDPERLRQDNRPNVLHYFPDGVAAAAGAPYVYFRAHRSATTGRYEYGDVFDVSSTSTFVPSSYSHTTTNVAVPYLESDSTSPPAGDTPATERYWRALETFQILSPGLDGLYSEGTGSIATFRYTKSGHNFTNGDFDNLTNFAENQLEDEMQ